MRLAKKIPIAAALLTFFAIASTSVVGLVVESRSLQIEVQQKLAATADGRRNEARQYLPPISRQAKHSLDFQVPGHFSAQTLLPNSISAILTTIQTLSAKNTSSILPKKTITTAPTHNIIRYSVSICRLWATTTRSFSIFRETWFTQSSRKKIMERTSSMDPGKIPVSRLSIKKHWKSPMAMM